MRRQTRAGDDRESPQELRRFQHFSARPLQAPHPQHPLARRHEQAGAIGAGGRHVLKTYKRKDTKFQPLVFTSVIGFVLVSILVALVIRSVGAPEVWLKTLAAVVLGPPIAWAGYTFLRDPELEAYSGMPLALRSMACGLVFGFLRRRDPLATVLLVMVGCVVAAALMLWTGLLLGPDDPTTMLESAAVGTRADAPLEVAGTAVYLAWPMPALVGILIALLSRSD